MYTQIFLVTSVRGRVLAPQIVAIASLSFFGAKMPFPAFFIPAPFIASLYAPNSPAPDSRPIKFHKGGPCFAAPPFSAVWHCAHFALYNFAPFFTFPAGTSTSGSGGHRP